jgi:brp/blh family beta-carotene 15,15'-monooxygenase
MNDLLKIKPQERIPNYELLRILAMFFIVLGHMSRMEGGGETLLRYFPVPQHVDCFVLITGFFLINAPFCSSRYYKVLIEAVFYTGGITLAMFFLTGNVSLYDLFKSFYPLGGTKFSSWFVYNYLGLIIMQPFLTKLVASLSKQAYQLLLVALTILCTTFIRFVFPMGEIYCNGWSVWWFVCLFLFGGYLRLYADTLPPLPWGKILLALMIFILVASKWLFFITYEYNSLHVLAMAICSFMWIKELKFPIDGWLTKSIRIISPHIFAIYLIHEHGLLQPYLLSKFNAWGLHSENIFIATGYLIVITINIFIFSIIFDKTRIWLFKITRIEKITNFISSITDNMIVRYTANNTKP